MLNTDAFFSDGTQDYRNPCEPLPYDTVTIRFRTGKEGIDSVRLVTEEDFWQMAMKESDSLFDYYENEFELADQVISYYFEVYGDSKIWYYNRAGAALELHKEFNFMITPGFQTPDWAKGAVFYQIFVDRFFNGDVTNDVVDGEYSYINTPVRKVTDWSKYPDSFGIGEFYGGDLQGVIKKLDYLQDLGIEAIYFNPIFVSPSNHKYDTQDYDFVDPHYGVIKRDGGEVLALHETNNRQATKYRTRVTDSDNLNASNELLIRLVEEAHKRGLKVILDGVFNHCGSFHKWLDREGIYEGMVGYEKGAYADKNSPYISFFRFKEDRWPDNSSYDGWWGHDTLPKLNYEESPILYNYVMDIAKKWVSPPFNCDGWRLDVAADLGYSKEFNHRFFRDFRKSVKEANPEAIIFAEHYGDPKSWLSGDEWDTVMNYDAFMEPLTWFLTGMEKHSDEYKENLLNRHDIFFQAMSYHMSRYQTTSLYTTMNELSNHDHSRFLTRTNKKVGRTDSLGPNAANEGVNKGVFRSAVTVQMTWVGAPTIYYGDEAGVCGFTDPDNRRTFPWGNEDMNLIDFHKEIISIHKDYEALRTGSILFLEGALGFISYGRFNRVDKFIVAVNNNNYEITEVINTWKIGISDEDTLCRLLLTTEEGYYREAVVFHTENGILKITMPPVSSVIIKNIISP
ncbi:glycoside hydrolase family 13 protein [Anaerocolumna sp. MB42-C2]|uniref:glycoside hydrolase family 13 protein n=1 Tax=Anaerocolumna sp. MB42-C2 TaxID=3070997 RepID=UPI0027E1A58B|nr:glycoside hydrolase family 13 protein [Anaerocolumna sp. MB42-C2]WMJ90548.1 glycoside hydrolase family 13 protein [Anaerocolumna sp. MB42-C2]